MQINRFIVIPSLVSCMVAMGACTLDKQAAPALTGPSETGLSISVSASPDQLPEDGQSTSMIRVVALDAHSQPVPGLSLHGDILAPDPTTQVVGPTDLRGTLMSPSISTDGNGVATVMFTAPIMQASDTGPIPIQVRFTPVSGNFVNDVAHSVTLQLSLPSTITLPGLVAKFTFSNGSAGTHFDASGSSAPAGRGIVSYDWDFGDGSPHGSGVTVDHGYGGTGPFTVTLRITDSAGQVGFATQIIKF